MKKLSTAADFIKIINDFSSTEMKDFIVLHSMLEQEMKKPWDQMDDGFIQECMRQIDELMNGAVCDVEKRISEFLNSQIQKF